MGTFGGEHSTVQRAGNGARERRLVSSLGWSVVVVIFRTSLSLGPENNAGGRSLLNRVHENTCVVVFFWFSTTRHKIKRLLG